MPSSEQNSSSFFTTTPGYACLISRVSNQGPQAHFLSGFLPPPPSDPQSSLTTLTTFIADNVLQAQPRLKHALRAVRNTFTRMGSSSPSSSSLLSGKRRRSRSPDLIDIRDGACASPTRKRQRSSCAVINAKESIPPNPRPTVKREERKVRKSLSAIRNSLVGKPAWAFSEGVTTYLFFIITQVQGSPSPSPPKIPVDTLATSTSQIFDLIMVVRPPRNVLVLALWYITRLVPYGFVHHRDFSGGDCVKLLVRLYTLGLMLAFKWLEDRTASHTIWQHHTGLPLLSLHRLEFNGILLLDYNISISNEEWKSWLQSLRTKSPLATRSNESNLAVSAVIDSLYDEAVLQPAAPRWGDAGRSRFSSDPELTAESSMDTDLHRILVENLPISHLIPMRPRPKYKPFSNPFQWDPAVAIRISRPRKHLSSTSALYSISALTASYQDRIAPQGLSCTNLAVDHQELVSKRLTIQAQ